MNTKQPTDQSSWMERAESRNYFYDTFGNRRRIVPPGEGIMLDEDGYPVVDRQLRAEELGRDAMQRFGMAEDERIVAVIADAVIQFEMEEYGDLIQESLTGLRDLARLRDGWRVEQVPTTEPRWIKPDGTVWSRRGE